MIRNSLLITALTSSLLGLSGNAQTTIEDINFDWHFAKGDQSAAIATDFDDSSWQSIDLPHDWAISGPFGAPEAHGGQAKLPWHGEGWYRKSFELPADTTGKRLQFIFDGVMASPTIYLNGKEVGSWTYGYNSFHLDATDAANFGGSNVITVHADTREHFSRWYPGGGIYRKITARLVDAIHIPVWGVHVTTPSISDDEAQVEVAIEIENTLKTDNQVGLEATLIGPDGKRLESKRQNIQTSAGSVTIAKLGFKITDPQRWDIDHPHRYRIETVVYRDGDSVHTESTPFGIRTIDWTADKGFFLNGRRVQLYGVNLHHDHGPLGSAFYPRAMERQLEILQEMGVNSIRTSHNPSAPELLELCDRMGLLVYNELFDKYGIMSGVRTTPADYVDHYAEREIRNFMRRDRNHPSVFTWSIANENGPILRNEDGKAPQHVTKMVGYFKKYDDTRPITMGVNNPSAADKNKHILEALDTISWNYQEKFLTSLENYPDKGTCQSESASAFGTRGAYKLRLPKHKTDYSADGECNAFLLTAAPWADIPEVEIDRMIRYPQVAGEYIWSGFDYLGEPTPYIGKKTNGKGVNPHPKGWEARSSYFGVVDLVGFPKDTYYLYRSYWRPEQTTLHLAPHWNWQEGDRVPAMLYTNGDEAELFLNGKSLGRRKKGERPSTTSTNFAFGKTARASSEQILQDKKGNVQAENFAYKAVDGNLETRWCADGKAGPQNWQVDLGAAQDIACVRISWERSAELYDFEVALSADGTNWTSIDSSIKNSDTMSLLTFPTTQARHLRIRVNEIQKHYWASIAEVEVFKTLPEDTTTEQPLSNPYYDIVKDYRLCWFNIPWEPGELRAVAYQDGQRIGETSVQTAGAPAALRLTPDRTELTGDGMDLCYVTIEMVDAEGRLCPLAMDRLHFSVEGPATLAGVGNGNPMDFDPFTDDKGSLSYGKAMAILRVQPNATGIVQLTVSSETGLSSSTKLQVSTQ
jgi:beta-galactosidase